MMAHTINLRLKITGRKVSCDNQQLSLAFQLLLHSVKQTSVNFTNMQILITQLLQDLKKRQWDLKCITEYIKLDI